MRLSRYALTLLSLCVAAIFAGCDAAIQAVDAAARTAVEHIPASPAAEPGQIITVGASRPASTAPGAETVRVASFNIQAFGPKKSSDDWAMQRIAAIVRQFDVVAIQEIRSQDQGLMDVLTRYVNADGSSYNYLLGERLGRTSSKEQYAYIFDTRRIAPYGDVYTVRDEEDLLHREPFVARFAVIGRPGSKPFSFSLANVHTDPDEVPQELQALARVYRAAVAYEAGAWGEDDFIMLGDFNADAQMLAQHATAREYAPAITREPTNIAGNAQYDNALLSGWACEEFTGRCGVLDFPTQFGLSTADAKKISDHLPIWCEFYADEMQPRPGNPVSTTSAR